MNQTVADLKQESDRSLLKPVFTKLATVEADIRLFLEEAADSDRQAFYALLDSIEDIFSMYDLRSVGAEVGSSFDANLHTAIQRKTTDDEALDRTIARVTRQGLAFPDDTRAYLPAQVAVWRYQPAQRPGEN